MDADVIVVGARCAGAPLATWLARGGAKVLLLDAAALPRDQSQSTHLIQPYGIDLLDELGVGEAVRAVASPIRKLATLLDGDGVTIDFAERFCICPRRTELDSLLLDEARRSGAELMLETKVTDLVREGERVSGVVAEQRGRRRVLRAPMVVGADGRRSTIARLVEAEEYDAADAGRAAYWAYWPRPDSYDRDDATRETAFLAHDGDVIGVCTPTGTNQLLLGVIVPRERLESWRGDVKRSFFEQLRAHSFMRQLVGDGCVPGKLHGTRSERFFFRRAAGPGWALVGDAGLHKDPTPGLGISDALRDARSLARAILAGGHVALEVYWRERDLASVELFHFARDLGEPGYNNPFNRAVMAKVGSRPELMRRFRAAIDRDVPPYAALPPAAILGAVAGQILRGRLGVLGPFLAAGKRAGEVKKARRRCERALQQLSEAELPAGPAA